MEEYGKKQPSYVPSELINCSSSNSGTITYHCYLIELQQDYKCEFTVQDIVLAIRSELDQKITSMPFEMCADRGNLLVNIKPLDLDAIHLLPDQVQKCRRFQTTLFRILLTRDVNKLPSVSDEFSLGDNPEIDYLLLPTVDQRASNPIIDWNSVFSSEISCECKDDAHYVRTRNDLVCSCKLQNCVVSTPHNGFIYIIDGIMKSLDGNSLQLHQTRKGERATTYKEHFKDHHRIELCFENQPLLRGRSVFKVINYLQKCRQKKKEKALSGQNMENRVQLPPELCSIIMSPITINTIYSFSFIPSIMHRLESLLVAFNLKKMLLDHCTQNDIPVLKVLEATTAKGSQEEFDYDSLETLGDSFLKYACSQQLFKTYQNYREGPLTEERKKLISNKALFEYGCNSKLSGFIRQETFNPKKWVVPGDKSQSITLKEELVSSRTRVYVRGKQKMKVKVVADVVEALIGVFLNTGDEKAALSFINWIGIKIDTNIIPYERNLSIALQEHVNVNHIESRILNYTFQDPTLLVEALTHGSYKQLPNGYNYQRLEFLGDAVLDYVITKHFYNKYADQLSSDFLTDMRSISVNNECYALSAIRANLDEHIRCDSEVKKQIAATVKSVDKLSLKSTFGWELETHFCRVLADVIESIAGAIFVDSRYDKEVVFRSIMPLLEPLVTPETAKRHPIRELKELCQTKHYEMKETINDSDATSVTVTITVKGDGNLYKHSETATNKYTARKVASKEVLKLLKETR